MKKPLEERLDDAYRRCGIHSNIPACCVEFYITRWRRHAMYKSWTGRGYNFLKFLWYPADRIPAYVPCPKCLIRRHARPTPLYECEDSRLPGQCEPTGRILGFDHDRRPAYSGEICHSFRYKPATCSGKSATDSDSFLPAIPLRFCQVWQEK